MRDFDYYLEDVQDEQGRLFELISKQKIDLNAFTHLYFETHIHRGIDDNNPRYATMSAEDIYEKVHTLTDEYATFDKLASWFGQLYANLHSATSMPSTTLCKTLPIDALRGYFDPDVDAAAHNVLKDAVYFGEDDKLMSPYVIGSFKVNGTLYNSVYQHILYRKAQIAKNFAVADRILQTTQTHKLRELNKSIKNVDYKKWVEIRPNVIFTGVYNFYTQNKQLLEEVKKNKGKLLVYASNKDEYLSVGLPMSATTLSSTDYWRGQNNWGVALMNTLNLL